MLKVFLATVLVAVMNVVGLNSASAVEISPVKQAMMTTSVVAKTSGFQLKHLGPVITDRSGSSQDVVRVPSQRGATYTVSHNKKTGEWKLVGNAKRGYYFVIGNKRYASVYYTGKVNTVLWSDCDRFVKSWRPSYLPKSVKVSCIDPGVMYKDWAGWYSGYHISSGSDAGFLVRDSRESITIVRGFTASEMKNILFHETGHWMTNGWSVKKQRAFLKQVFKVSNWDDTPVLYKGSKYKSLPTESWANAFAVCHGMPNGDYKPLPGGCATVNKWKQSSFEG